MVAILIGANQIRSFFYSACMQICLVTINVTQPKSQTDTEIETVVQSQYRIIRIDLCNYTFVCARTFIYLLSVLYAVRKNKPKSKRWFNGVFLSVKQNQMGNRFLNKVHHWGILLDVIQRTIKKIQKHSLEKYIFLGKYSLIMLFC